MFVENKTIEFKREYVDDIKNTIIAFANCDGGTLYIGVNDDGEICGVNDVDDTMLRVTNAIRDAVRPDVTMFVECSNDTMEDKSVVRVTVQRGTARPYYLQKKGIRPEGVYVRQGASTVPATDTAILNMIKETSGDSYKNYDNRVSAMTGLPTVLGWYVHEWLWRNNLEEENQRKEEVQTIYTSSNVEQIKSLIEKYKISYLFIGSCEAEKYGEINSELLTSLGKVVFRQGETMIIEVSDGERAD